MHKKKKKRKKIIDQLHSLRDAKILLIYSKQLNSAVLLKNIMNKKFSTKECKMVYFHVVNLIYHINRTKEK